jgi:alpha-mannosidase
MDIRIIDAKLRAIQARYTEKTWAITGWEGRLGMHLAPEQYAYEGGWQAVTGESWWQAGKTLFLRAQAETPPGVAPEDLYLKVEMDGMEGQLNVNGSTYSGIDRFHSIVALPFSGQLNLALEFMVLGASLYEPELRQEKARLKHIDFIQINREARDTYYDLSFAWEASLTTRDERRRSLLHAALEEALLIVDLTAAPADFRAQLRQARQTLRDRIAAIAPDPEGGQVVLTGHSHIDTAWLWPLRETVRKTGRTFSTACRLMERYPDYYFSCSQPQLYAYAKQFYPDLYEEVKKWVKTGRWECTGGLWVEPDCNIPSGEAMIRQVLYGTAFFEEEFGVTPRSCWLPDVFGYPASLPAILAGCGIRYFYTNKLHWQARNPFPYSLFWWEGLDGQRVLAHIPKLQNYYNGVPNPEQISKAWENYQEKAVYPELLLPYGYGDGGGGPTEEMLEFASRAGRYPGLPATRPDGAEAFFARAAESPAAANLPLWSGELYLETHRGTYTTHGEIKKANRQSELLLRDAEIFASLAALRGAQMDFQPLKPAWLNVVLLQFHDILPGSSIAEVYAEAAVDHARIHATARQVRSAALASMTREGAGLVAFNSLSWERSDIVRADIPALAGLASAGIAGEALEVVQANGTTVPAQVVARSEAGVQVIFPAEQLPALGYRAYRLRGAAAPAESSLRVSARAIESRFYILELGEDGTLTRLYDRRADRELIPAGSSANQLLLLQDGPEREAAWNVHNTLDRRGYDWEGPASISIRQAGPVAAALRVEKRFRNSKLVQDVVLYDGLARIDFVTRVEWEERQVLLKASFPLEVRTPDAAFEVQFGIVKRATHRNTSWEQEKFEVCGHHWADLSETGYGASLLNDCKYGYDVNRSTLRLTLLRGTEFPDPNADRGVHEFTYSLLPHSGDVAAADTVRRAWELNVPVTCAAGAPASGLPEEQSFFTVSGPAVLDTIKPAEDGNGWILRLYEPYGGRGKVSVRGPVSLRQVTCCDHLERNGETLESAGQAFTFAIRPFEVKTFRILPE